MGTAWTPNSAAREDSLSKRGCDRARVSARAKHSAGDWSRTACAFWIFLGCTVGTQHRAQEHAAPRTAVGRAWACSELDNARLEDNMRARAVPRQFRAALHPGRSADLHADVVGGDTCK